MSEDLKRDFKGIWIPKELWEDTHLTKMEMLLFVEIDSLSNYEKGCFAGNTHLGKFLGVSSSRASQIVTSLKKKGYIKVDLTYSTTNTKQVVKREIHPINILSRGVVNKLKDPTKNIKAPPLENCEGSKPGLGNHISNKDIVGPHRPSSSEIPFKEIIDYLNHKAEKNYRLAETNKGYISSRWNEGYGLKDFKQVVDNKCASWLNDPKMNEYLRPSTLFGKKFDDYLNSIPKSRSKSKRETGTNWDVQKPAPMSHDEYLKKREALQRKLANIQKSRG